MVRVFTNQFYLFVSWGTRGVMCCYLKRFLDYARNDDLFMFVLSPVMQTSVRLPDWSAAERPACGRQGGIFLKVTLIRCYYLKDFSTKVEMTAWILM